MNRTAVATALLFFASLQSTGCAAPPAPAASAAPASAETSGAWGRMAHALVGTWRAPTASGKVVTEAFRFVSNESALVETFLTPSGRETISVYHLDRGTLLLTHYCAQGNQPRLRAFAVSEERMAARYLDATNVLAGQAVMVERELLLESGALRQTEIYRQPDGSLETTVLRFERVDAAGVPAASP